MPTCKNSLVAFVCKQFLLIQDVVESTGGRNDLKRRLSEVVPGSPRAASPMISADYLPSLHSEDTVTEKRTRIEDPSSPGTDLDTSSNIRESYESRRKRFLRTAEALRQSGLLNITMKTADLLRKNQELQREIENLQQETKTFVLSVLSNPENRHILDNIRSGAQLYEVVVPGSQGIMSVSTQRPDVTSSSPSTTTTPANMLIDQSPSSPPSRTPSPSPSLTSTMSSVSSPSSLSDDNDTSEEENLAPPKSYSSTAVKTKH
ncbi:hypothetical protein Pmani_032093 [Petrolisthes manimaculis]|uniref:Uncharacterized protein n=1 Tax=Petrolisthes manimaculis TaxID=1843537 RepID=A0AAE1TRS2_9EUCA|nr:hypothetical protein Pmani_032093 [Petrolisthes manimaculis]